VPASPELLLLLAEPTLTRSTTITKGNKETLQKKTKVKTKVKKLSNGLKSIRRGLR
jgi:hypothetical protein